MGILMSTLYGKPRQCIKKQRHYFVDKVCTVKAVILPVVTYRCESWTIKKAGHQRIDVFGLWCGEDSWESLGQQEMKPVNPKGNQPWMFTGRTDAKAEAPILWPPDANSRFTGNDPDAGKHWGQEEKGVTEDEMVGWHHGLNRHKSEQIPADSEGQGSLACGNSMEVQRIGHDLVTQQQQWLSMA